MFRKSKEKKVYGEFKTTESLEDFFEKYVEKKVVEIIEHPEEYPFIEIIK